MSEAGKKKQNHLRKFRRKPRDVVLRAQGGRFRDGVSLIHTADDRVLAFGGDCSLVLVYAWKRSAKEYHEIAKIPNATAGRQGDAWPRVTLSDGWVLCKNRQRQLTARRIEDRK